MYRLFLATRVGVLSGVLRSAFFYINAYNIPSRITLFAAADCAYSLC